jgi:hypothetical protein
MSIDLLAKINAAVAAANEAETAVTTAQDVLVSRSKAVGLLLLEAKKLHPVAADFETFLEQVHGLKKTRAYDLMRLAGGRTTDEEIRKATRERVKKHRASKKLPRPAPKKISIDDRKAELDRLALHPLREPEPPILSVTSPDVTETAEASAETRKALNADFDRPAEEKAAELSAHYLIEFTAACRTCLPKITVEEDRREAHLIFLELSGSKLTKEAA